MLFRSTSRYSPEKPPSGASGKRRSGSGHLSSGMSQAGSMDPDALESASLQSQRDAQEDVISLGSSELVDDDPLAAYLGGRLPASRPPEHQASLRETWSGGKRAGSGSQAASGLNLSELLGTDSR